MRGQLRAALRLLRWPSGRPFSKPRIYYVSDGAKWSFFWDGHYITEGLRANCGRDVVITHHPWDLRGQIIHFGDRYTYLYGDYARLHPSNHVFLTWFHGEANTQDAEMQKIFARLPGALPYLRRIVTSCHASEKALLEVGVPPRQIAVIPIGVDLQHFQPPQPGQRDAMRAELGIPPEAFCIGSFQKDGNGWEEGLTPKWVKGPDVFLNVIERLAAQNPNLMVLLTGPARGYIKTGLERLGVQYVHRLLDDYQDIVRYYHALDMYLITSRIEGGPKGLMESWATGVPVVSTRMGMPADYGQHGENILLAENEDLDGLTAACQTLIESETTRQKLSAGGLVSVQPLDWRVVAAQYDRLLYAPIFESRR